MQELAGWGGRPRSAATIIPVTTPDDLVLPHPGARGAIPRGLGRAYGDAALNAGGAVLDLTGLDGTLDLDATTGVVVVDGGTSLDAIQRLALPEGWALPVVPGTAQVTVGGAVAADVHGKNAGAGSFGAHLDEVVVHTPTGVHRTRPGDDLFRATVGGMGLTGAVVQARLQLTRVRTSWLRVDTDRTADLDGAVALLAADSHEYAVAWLDLRSRRGRSVVTRADVADRDELPAGADPWAVPSRPTVTVPAAVPTSLVRPSAVRAFNALRWARAPRSERGRPLPRTAVLHPLDGLDRWHRLHGPRGFVQYQLGVPEGRVDVVRAVVGRLRDAGVPILLAVLKRLGQGAGMLSFPQPGWTLALDLPPADGLGPVLDGCDDLVADAGGRIYLAKDARLGPAAFRAMYPQADRWCQVRDAVDPGGVLRSDLGRRLGLVR